MFAEELPGTCALQVIADVHEIGATTPFELKYAEKFSELLEPGHGAGHYKTKYITASIVTIQDSDEEHYDRAKKFLEAHGFKHLGSWPGAHPKDYSKEYKNHLFGSKEFEK